MAWVDLSEFFGKESRSFWVEIVGAYEEFFDQEVVKGGVAEVEVQRLVKTRSVVERETNQLHHTDAEWRHCRPKENSSKHANPLLESISFDLLFLLEQNKQSLV